MPTAAYTLEVDWTNTDTWVDETANLLSVSIDRGFASPLARMAKVGRGTFVLSNRTKAYSPALQANVLPRRPVRFTMTVSATPGVLFRGFTQSIKPTAGAWDARTVTLECVDAIALLDMHEGPIALGLNYRADELIRDVVAAVYTPPATAYDKGISVFPITADRWSFGEWSGFDLAVRQEQGARASRKIQDACASDWGRFYVGKSGSPTYANRHNIVLNSTTAFTVADDCVTLNYEKNIEDVFNVVDVTVTPRSLGTTLEVLGRVDRPIKLEANASQLVTIRFTDPATRAALGGYGMLAPVAGTDYIATSDEAGEGTAVTGSVSAAMTAYSDRADITLTNGSASVVYVRGPAGGLQVRGYAVRARQAVTATAQSAGSITAYQKRRLAVSAPLSDSESYAQRLADYLLGFSAAPPDKVRGVTLWANRDTTSLAYARDAELLNRVVVTEAQTGLSAYAGYVFGLKHTITGMAEHTLTLDLETAPSVGTPFQLGVSQMGGTDVMVF